MAAWPNIGVWLLDAVSEEPQPNAWRTDMESGPAVQTPIDSRAMVRQPRGVLLSSAEYAQFKDWFRIDLARGTAWFDLLDNDGETKPFRFVRSNGQPPYTAKAYVATPGAPLSWDVRFTLETWGP